VKSAEPFLRAPKRPRTSSHVFISTSQRTLYRSSKKNKPLTNTTTHFILFIALHNLIRCLDRNHLRDIRRVSDFPHPIKNKLGLSRALTSIPKTLTLGNVSNKTIEISQLVPVPKPLTRTLLGFLSHNLSSPKQVFVGGARDERKDRLSRRLIDFAKCY